MTALTLVQTLEGPTAGSTMVFKHECEPCKSTTQCLQDLRRGSEPETRRYGCPGLRLLLNLQLNPLRATQRLVFCPSVHIPLGRFRAKPTLSRPGCKYPS